jgi:hypothetical protein
MYQVLAIDGLGDRQGTTLCYHPNEILLGERRCAELVEVSRTPTSAAAARSTLALTRQIGYQFGYFISKTSRSHKFKWPSDRPPHTSIRL